MEVARPKFEGIIGNGKGDFIETMNVHVLLCVMISVDSMGAPLE